MPKCWRVFLSSDSCVHCGQRPRIPPRMFSSPISPRSKRMNPCVCRNESLTVRDAGPVPTINAGRRGTIPTSTPALKPLKFCFCTVQNFDPRDGNRQNVRRIPSKKFAEKAKMRLRQVTSPSEDQFSCVSAQQISSLSNNERVGLIWQGSVASRIRRMGCRGDQSWSPSRRTAVTLSRRRLDNHCRYL